MDTEPRGPARPLTRSEEIDIQEMTNRVNVLTQEGYRLEGRIYSLEKEMALVANLVTIGAVIGAYFLYKWYMENYASHTIEGVVNP